MHINKENMIYIFYIGVTIICFVLEVSNAGDFCNTLHGQQFCAWGCCHLECCDHSDAGVVTGITIGGVVVVVAILVGLCCWKRRYMMQQAQLIRQRRYKSLVAPSTPSLSSVGTQVGRQVAMYKPNNSTHTSSPQLSPRPSPGVLRLTPIVSPLQDINQKYRDPPPEYDV